MSIFSKPKSGSSSSPTQSGGFSLLDKRIQTNIENKGYDQPTPIQSACIAPLINHQDLLGTAQTGTGKTAAFSLPLLHLLSTKASKPRRGQPQALILAPTRELAAQIGDCLSDYSKGLNIYHAVIFGGVSQKPQVAKLDRGVHIVVATPGRLLDLMNQKHITLDQVKFFILDEVDRMLDMGFIRDINRITEELPTKRQTGFFSATLSPPIEKLANTLLENPERVSIAPKQPAVERIEQKLCFVAKVDKPNLLISLLEQQPEIEKVVVFTRMKHVANRIAKKLETKKIEAAAIHGNKSQGARTRALEGFKDGTFRVLVATDVAARGLDVDGITHVINLDLPTEAETYIHRIGRTGRAGASGCAISFCCPEESEELRDIEAHLRKPIEVDTDHKYAIEFSRTRTKAKKTQAKSTNSRGSNRRSNSSRRRRPNRKAAARS